MSKSQFVSFVPKTLDDNIHSRDINDDVIATVKASTTIANFKSNLKHAN